MNPLGPSEFADTLRNRASQRWDDAYEHLLAILRSRKFRSHPALEGLPPAEFENRIREVASRFWLKLVANPAKLEASRVHSWGTIKAELRRHLRDEGPDALADNWSPRLHVWRKVNTALKSDPRRFVRVATDVWMLNGTRSSRTAASGEQIVANLGRLPYEAKVQREGQLPIIVDANLLPDFLATALKEAARSCSTAELTGFVWACLDPRPDAVLFMHADSFAEGEESKLGSARDVATDVEDAHWAERVDIVAQAALDRLPRDVLLTARAHHVEEKTFDVIESESAVLLSKRIKRSTVGNYLKQFKEILAGVVRENDLSKRQAAQLVDVVLDRLRLGGFQ